MGLDLRNSTCKGTFYNPNVSFVLISIILSDSVAIQETIHDFEQVGQASKVEVFLTSS